MRRTDHQAAYEALLKRYLNPLQRLAYGYARDPTAREDLFQEIALALWTALPSFRGDASERTWLYRVAHNTAIRFTTRRMRRARHEQADEGVAEPVSSADPERSAIEAQQRDRLWLAVQALPVPDRQVVMVMLATPLTQFLTAPGLWIGLALTAVFLYGAVRLRRVRGVI